MHHLTTHTSHAPPPPCPLPVACSGHHIRRIAEMQEGAGRRLPASAVMHFRSAHGACCAGVDKSIEDFDRELSKNLYRIVWNRMSPPEATSRHPCVALTYRKAMLGEPDRSEFRRSPRPHRPDGGQTTPGTDSGTGVPPGFVWISAWEVRARLLPRQSPAALLGLLTGVLRPRHQEFLR